MNKQQSPSAESVISSPYDLERERMVCQLKAMIRAEWPDEFGVKRADLKVVKPDGKLVWPKKQRRKNLARMKTAGVTNATARKKGGPRQARNFTDPTLATVFRFPGALIGDDLYEQWEWMSDNYHKWETTDTHGRKPFDKNGFAMLQGMNIADGLPPITEHTMRKDVQEGRVRIEARNRIKIYLERRGVDLDTIRNAEDALFALFGFVETTP
jgi:hypothetical protein